MVCILEKSIRNPPSSAHFLSGHFKVIRVQDKMHTYVHGTNKEEDAGKGPVPLEVSVLF